jgi:hypothetical protein
MANIFFVIMFETSLLQKENSGMHASYMFSVLPSGSGKYCTFILREEYAIPVGIFWVYLPQTVVLLPLPCYLPLSHTISLNLAYLLFWNYNAQFVFTVLLGILSVCFIVIAFCVGTMSNATGMRPDTLQESILSPGWKGILQHVSIHTTYW